VSQPQSPRAGTGLESELAHALRAPLPAPPPLEGAARAAGLLEVAYVLHDSPLGALLLAAGSGGLLHVAFVEATGPQEALHGLAARVSPRILRAAKPLDAARRQLDEYFAGRRRRFELELDWRLARRGFSRRVLHATAQIPYGQTSSYKLIASAAGSPRAFRAAGSALGANPLAIVVPCHRVLATGGGLGGYGGGLERKRALLALERSAAGP
jgi:methylated-DNA-[protein]-cysteine S-methyltransferase